MLRKLYIAVDCADEAQKEEVQTALNEISNMRLLTAEKILGAYPYFRAHRSELTELFRMVAEGGAKSLMSGRGLSIITKLTKR